MVDALEILMNRVKLEEDETYEFIFNEEAINETTLAEDLCLLGKFLIKRPINLEAMKGVFTRAWKISYLIEVIKITAMIFLYEFVRARDRGKACSDSFGLLISPF